MGFIATTRPGVFQDELLDSILLQVHPFFMVRMKHRDDPHGRLLQGAVIEKPRDIPAAAEVLYIPGVRGMVV